MKLHAHAINQTNRYILRSSCDCVYILDPHRYSVTYTKFARVDSGLDMIIPALVGGAVRAHRARAYARACPARRRRVCGAESEHRERHHSRSVRTPAVGCDAP